MVIGWYVHHSGAGHRVRAGVVARELRGRGHEVVLLGSGRSGPGELDLPRDDDGPGPFVDPTAGGALHWLPLRHLGAGARMRAIAEWVGLARPDVVVVDVSAEVAALVRLLGVPTVVVAQPGERDDAPHRLAYRCATGVLAPWPVEARPCPALTTFRPDLACTGGISRFAGSAVDRREGPAVVLGGQDGRTGARLVDELRADVPDLEWVQVGGGVWVQDVGTVLRRAPVVVTHAGQNAVADVAALRVPAVVVPQPRPHREQEHLAAELDRLGLAALAHPTARAPWADLVSAAMDRGSRWERWGTDGAAGRAADLVEEVGRG